MGKRRKVEITERVIDGVLTPGKECTKCGEWKPLDEFHKQRDGAGGKRSMCKSCVSVRTGKWSELETKIINKEVIIGKKCKICGEWKPLKLFYKGKELGGRRAYCKNCERERKQKYYQENKETLIKTMRKYYQKNREKYRLNKRRRRARKKSLPNNWTTDQQLKTWSFFNNACALTGISNDITAEHAIPLSIGHGGTYHGNMYPMSKTLNNSKYNNNIFEWFEANKERFNLSEERFNKLIEYLATINGLTPEEYRQFVYWCHENPRTEDEIAADPRHSIEIWREETGLHFPLPAYAVENDNMSDNERSAS